MNQKLENFKESLDEIETMSGLPLMIRDHSIQTIKSFLDTSKLTHIANPDARKKLSENVIPSLNKISEESYKAKFDTIYLMQIALAVSILEETLENIFVDTINEVGAIYEPEQEKPRAFSINFDDLLQIKNGSITLGSIVAREKSISFADLQAILRSFNDFLKIDIQINADAKRKIIFYTQIRHCILHNAAKVSQKFLNSTSRERANIKNYNVNDPIIMSKDDWQNLRECFEGFVEIVTESIKTNLSKSGGIRGERAK